MIEYESNAELQQIVDNQIATLAEFSALRVGRVSVKAWLKTKVDAEGEPVQVAGSPVKLRKLDQLARAMSSDDVPVDYTLSVDGYRWVNFPAEREPLVHFGLMHAFVEQDDEGNVKRKTRKPDVVGFTETFSRFGAWNSVFSQVAELLQGNARGVAERLTEEI